VHKKAQKNLFRPHAMMFLACVEVSGFFPPSIQLKKSTYPKLIAPLRTGRISLPALKAQKRQRKNFAAPHALKFLATSCRSSIKRT
jgi:hypothetical protein